MNHHPLEIAYWCSQIALTCIALAAAIAAAVQIRSMKIQTRSMKLFEMLKYLESTDTRASRRIVLREIRSRKDEDWWTDQQNGERLEAAASNVCASYDILGKMIKADPLGYGTFFQQGWARNVIDNHDALARFLNHRRERIPNAYSDFSALAEQVQSYTHIVEGKAFQKW